MKHKVLCYALALSIGSILVGCNSNESSEIKSTTTTASSITTISTTTKIITSTTINTTKISTKLSTTSTTSATQSTTTVVNYTENNTPGALTDAQLRNAATELGIPEGMYVSIEQSTPEYWDGGGMWITYITVYFEGSQIASCGADSYTGTPQTSIQTYTPCYDAGIWFDGKDPKETTMPNIQESIVQCPDCGFSWSTIVTYESSITCPSCNYCWFP